MNFKPSLNYGALRTQDLQQFKGKEKEAEKPEQGGGKGTTPQVETPKSEPITASVLDVVAQQNMGLGIVNKKTPVMEGAAKPEAPNATVSIDETKPSSVEGEQYRDYDYSQLVALWNSGNNNLSLEDQFWLLENLWIQAPTNEDRGHWAVFQSQVYKVVKEQALNNMVEGFLNGTLDPHEVYDGYLYGNIPGTLPWGAGCHHCWRATFHWDMEGISNETQIAMLYETIESDEQAILTYEIALEYNPNLGTTEIHSLEDLIRDANNQIALCRARIAELEGNAPQAVTVQLDNGPAVQ